MALSPAVKPFHGWFYNTGIVKRYSSVVCPPYDVIDKKKKDFCYKKSPYNFCRILLKEEGKTYRDLAERFREWLDNGIFIRDEKESLYLYRQRFTVAGKRLERIGVIGLLSLDDTGLIHPHEYTHQKAKDDRFNVLKETQANLEAIFVISPQRFKHTRLIYRKIRHTAPKLSCTDEDRVQHTLWAVNTKGYLERIGRECVHKKLVIADGHHRFEVSREYFSRIGKESGLQGSRYLLAYFTDVSALTVFPTHRIITLRKSLPELIRVFSGYFAVRSVKNSTALTCRLEKTYPDTFSFGVYHNRKYLLFSRKKEPLLNEFPFPGQNRIVTRLDVFLLHKVVFDIMMKVPQGTEISYTHSEKEAVKMAQGRNRYAFMLKATSLNEIILLAKRGIRLPQKSTYFYPKVLSGMLLRRL